MASLISVIKHRGGTVLEVLLVVLFFSAAVYLLEGDAVSTPMDTVSEDANVKWATEKYFREGFSLYQQTPMVFTRKMGELDYQPPAFCPQGTGVTTVCSFLDAGGNKNWGCCTKDPEMPNLGALCPDQQDPNGNPINTVEANQNRNCVSQFTRYICTKTCLNQQGCSFWNTLAQNCSGCPQIMALLPAVNNSLTGNCPDFPVDDPAGPVILRWNFIGGGNRLVTPVDTYGKIYSAGLQALVQAKNPPGGSRVWFYDITHSISARIGIKRHMWMFNNATNNITWALPPTFVVNVDLLWLGIAGNYDIALFLEVLSGPGRKISDPIIWGLNASFAYPAFIDNLSPCADDDPSGMGQTNINPTTTTITNFNCNCPVSCMMMRTKPGQRLDIQKAVIAALLFFFTVAVRLLGGITLGVNTKTWWGYGGAQVECMGDVDMQNDINIMAFSSDARFIFKKIDGGAITWKCRGKKIFFNSGIIELNVNFVDFAGLVLSNNSNVTFNNGTNVNVSTGVLAVVSALINYKAPRLHGGKGGYVHHHSGRFISVGVWFNVLYRMGGTPPSVSANRLPANRLTGAVSKDSCGEYFDAMQFNANTQLTVDTTCTVTAKTGYTSYSEVIAAETTIASQSSLYLDKIGSSTKPMLIENGGLLFASTADSYLEINLVSVPSTTTTYTILKHKGSSCVAPSTVGKVVITPACSSCSVSAATTADGYCTYTLSVTGSGGSGGGGSSSFVSAAVYSLLLDQTCPAYTCSSFFTDLAAFPQYPTSRITNCGTSCGSTLVTFQCTSTTSQADADTFCANLVSDANTAGSALNSKLKVISNTNRGSSSSSSNIGLVGLVALVVIPIAIIIGIIWWKSSQKKAEAEDYDYDEHEYKQGAYPPAPQSTPVQQYPPQR